MAQLPGHRGVSINQTFLSFFLCHCCSTSLSLHFSHFHLFSHANWLFSLPPCCITTTPPCSLSSPSFLYNQRISVCFRSICISALIICQQKQSFVLCLVGAPVHSSSLHPKCKSLPCSLVSFLYLTALSYTSQCFPAVAWISALCSLGPGSDPLLLFHVTPLRPVI